MNILNLFPAYRKLKEQLEWYRRTYLTAQGFTSMPDGTEYNYHLKSLDGGRNWYAVEKKDEGLIVLGKAEEVYPGLLQHLEAVDRLAEFIFSSRRPLNLGNPKEARLLTDAGFQIQGW